MDETLVTANVLVDCRCQRAAFRRRTDPQQIIAVWAAIRHIRIGKQVSNFDRVSRYLAREHEIPESDARKLLRRATSEGLVVVYTSVTSKGDNAGAEQDGYRVPSVEDEEDGEKARAKDSHDWYCFECHLGGEVLKCRGCWRVYHPECCNFQADQAFFCRTCQTNDSEELNLKDDLHRFLEFALIRMKEKSQPLFHLGVSDPEDEESQLKWHYLVYHPCDLEEMECKTKERKYRTLEEFRGDAATIQHNVHIVFGGQSPEVELARVMLADCDYELEQIRLCCDCYLNSNTKPKDWFSLPCRRLHQIVLAKQTGWPFWPAKVMKVTSNGYDVRFFGPGHHRALVPSSHVKPIVTSPRSLKLKASASKRYEGALYELSVYQKLTPVGYATQAAGALSNERKTSPNEAVLLGGRLPRGRARSWDPLRFSSPFYRRFLTFTQSAFTTDQRHNLVPFRRKRGRLTSCDKTVTNVTSHGEPPPKWKRAQSPLRDCTSGSIIMLKDQHVPMTNPRVQLSPVDMKPRRLDQSVQADLVCSDCHDHFSAGVQALKIELDEALKAEVESLRKRMNEEYAVDKERAVERILTCTQRELDHVRQSISELHRQQRDDLMRRVDMEHKMQLAALKKKQWCSNCENEAVYYCCWGTCYCSVECQKEHWETEHKNLCRHKPSA